MPPLYARCEVRPLCWVETSRVQKSGGQAGPAGKPWDISSRLHGAHAPCQTLRASIIQKVWRRPGEPTCPGSCWLHSVEPGLEPGGRTFSRSHWRLPLLEGGAPRERGPEVRLQWMPREEHTRADGGGAGWWPRWVGSRAQGRAAGRGRWGSGGSWVRPTLPMINVICDSRRHGPEKLHELKEHPLPRISLENSRKPTLPETWASPTCFF